MARRSPGSGTRPPQIFMGLHLIFRPMALVGRASARRPELSEVGNLPTLSCLQIPPFEGVASALFLDLEHLRLLWKSPSSALPPSKMRRFSSRIVPEAPPQLWSPPAGRLPYSINGLKAASHY